MSETKMSQEVTVESIKGLDRNLVYVVQYPSQITAIDKLKLVNMLKDRGIVAVLVPFELKFAEKVEEQAQG